VTPSEQVVSAFAYFYLGALVVGFIILFTSRKKGS
jgi:hypothetical protein